MKDVKESIEVMEAILGIRARLADAYYDSVLNGDNDQSYEEIMRCINDLYRVSENIGLNVKKCLKDHPMKLDLSNFRGVYGSIGAKDDK